jgi:DNA primase
MAAINDEFKEKVRQSSDIVDVISEYVPLKKRGRDYWACCPFHGEKTPSFSVSKEKQFFYCYGCHEGGDVFRFVMKERNCTFPEALKLLADRANIPIPEYKKTPEEIKRERDRDELLAVNDMASRYFVACLQKTKFGAKALEYLHQRGITDKIIQDFSLGAALNSFHSLEINLEKHGCTKTQLVKAGLIKAKDSKYHDFFINRFMIPIKDPRGRVIAFGGRVLDDSTPKYLNTGETVLFQKRDTLFGLDIAIKSIRAKRLALVVEGYMDAISLHAAGIDYAVASLGTAFSNDHARILRGLCDQVVLSYDSDDAGKRNAVRAVSILNVADVPVKVLTVPEVKDPDEYVRKFGKDAFEDLVQKAMDGTEFQIRYTISKNNIDNLAGKVKTVSNLIPFLVESKNQISVAAYIRLIARLLTIDEDLIMTEYRKATRGKKNAGTQQVIIQKPARDTKAMTAVEQAERKLLTTFLFHSELATDYQEKLHELGFTSQVRQKIFELLLASAGKSQEEISSSIFATDDNDLSQELLLILTDEDVKAKDALEKTKAVLNDCLKRMEIAVLEKDYLGHSKQAETYERTGDSRFMEELKISQDIKRKMKRLYGEK